MESVVQTQTDVKPSRRHSIAVALRRMSLTGHSDHPSQLFNGSNSGSRRGSIQDSLIQFSKNFKIGSAGQSSRCVSELGRFLSRTTLQAVLANHLGDKKIKITKMNTKQLTDSDTNAYEIEIWFKIKNQRRRIDLSVRIIHDSEDDELYVFNTIINDIKLYLHKKDLSNLNLVPVQEQIDCSKMQSSIEEDDEELSSQIENDLTKVFILESLFHRGYKDDISDLDGLDYEHSIMAISYLAKFHASSYCYRKEENIVLHEKYPELENIQMPTFTPEAVAKVGEILERSSQLCSQSSMFVDAMVQGVKVETEFLEHFRVLCHGNFLRENLQYCYRTELESRYFCSDLVFQNLSWCHIGSCVLDLLQFVFTSIDPEVRRNFLADFICSVYYDNFVKTVINVNQKLSIFRLKHFVREFEQNILYGFLFSLDLKLKLHENIENDNEECKDELENENRKLEEYIVALATDIVQFKANSRVSIFS